MSDSSLSTMSGAPAPRRHWHRTWGEKVEDASGTDDHYTTASGLVLHFIIETGSTSRGGEVTSALMETPEGLTFAVNSTLPREAIKALAEELERVK